MRASAKKIKKEPTHFPYFTKDMSRLILLFIPKNRNTDLHRASLYVVNHIFCKKSAYTIEGFA